MASPQLFARHERAQQAMRLLTMTNAGVYDTPTPDVLTHIRPEDLTGPARRAALQMAAALRVTQ